MQIVIIEDEKVAARDLITTIKKLQPQSVIVAQLTSVKEGLRFFEQHGPVDLIFSDIQLGDGLSFEIFTSLPIDTPIVFCTAYDEYALHAFKTNGIDYILKPFTDDAVLSAMKKYETLTGKSQSDHIKYQEILKILSQNQEEIPATVLVYYQNKILPIKTSHVALFYLEHEIAHLVTFDGKIYHYPNKSLEEIEQQAGRNFFRTNRQCLLNRDAIVDISNHLSRKLTVNISVPFKDVITISKERTPLFLKWLAGR